MIFSLARYFYYLHQNNIHNNIFLIPPLLIITVPFLLIMKQPDLGTAIILLMIGISMLFVAGIVWWKFALAGFLAIFVSPIIWHLLHDYQKKRILIFINPESDKLGSGYNIIQSKIAVGSGGLFGMGLGKGSQGQLGFLPEKHTDFIFSLLNEELGLIVAVIIISMYIMICWQMLKLACNNNNMFAKLVIIGLMNMFIFHVIINIAMVIGLMPVVGIPLPLLSYGGTITTTTLLSFGIIFSVNKAAY
jgi:rod shape determining protein RodA